MTERGDRDVLPGADAGRIAWLRSRAAAALGVSVAAIGPDLPLTSLGLDSLAAVELAQAVEAVSGAPVSMARLLEGATIAELAAEMAARAEEGEEEASGTALGAVAAEPAALSAVVPASWGQRGLWFLNRLDPTGGAYHIAAAATVSGELDPAAFRRALLALAARHPSLRTTLSAPAGEPVQVVHARLDPDFAEVDASSWEEARLEGYLAAEAFRPFDLAAGPLLRVRLLARAPGERVLLVAIHHAVADFASLAVAARDLGALYRVEAGGAPAALPALPATYADFAEREAARLAGPATERLWEFWRQRLGGELPTLDLPVDRPRTGVPGDRGGAVAVRLPAELSARLLAIARGSGATPFALLLAAYGALLSRHGAGDDLVVGTPYSVRGAGAFSGVMGYFVNPLPLRLDVGADAGPGAAGDRTAEDGGNGEADGGPRFEELLARARRTALDAFAHGELPFTLLAERLQPSRATGRTPVFQTLLTLHRPRPGEEGLTAFALGEPGGRLPLGGLGLDLVSRPLAERRAQFDLALTAAELDGALAMVLEYDADLFDAATVHRLAGHLLALLESAATDPGKRMGSLALLAEPESHQLLIEWNQDWMDGAGHQLRLHDLFARQARRTPGAEALVAREERLTYAELDARAEAVAGRLRAAGVGPEVRVGVALGRTPALVAALLGVLKAGGAYVPLDPRHPAERLAFLLRDAGARLLLADRGLPLPADVSVLRLDREESREAQPRAGGGTDLSSTGSASDSRDAGGNGGAPGEPGPGNLAYVLYTSGSTGRPKGVAVEHRSAVALMLWAREVFSPDDLAGVLAATSTGFDLSVFELFVPLSWGGRVILARDALELPELPAAGEVTLVNTVPSAAAELLRGGGIPSSVRVVNLAGEPLPAPLARDLYRLGTVRRVWNLYGPTEDTTYSTFAAADPEPAGPPPIGRPLAGTRADVADARGEPLPVGVPGELVLGGAGLARGYLGRPDLTAGRFVPAAGVPSGLRVYRTGDLVRRLPDGRLDYLGRIDQQVKVRGFRIEPGEIEAVLAEHPAVVAAAVLAREVLGDRRLVAFVVPASPLPPGELRSYLRGRLPEHMVPAVFATLDALPLTPNGKVDRRELARLAARLATHEPPAGGAELPRGPVEELLAGIWENLLGVERVGPRQDFFEMGGHSLLAARLLARVRAALGVDLPLTAVFERPTVAALAGEVEAVLRGGRHPDAALRGGPHPEAALGGRHPGTGSIPRRPAGEPAPLSLGQRRLWFLHQLDPESPAYHMPAAVRLRGRLDEPAFAAALAGVVRRHEVLRGRFVAAPGADEPVQEALPLAGALPVAAPAALPIVDLGALPAPVREPEALRLAAAEARRPFDLARGPLCRFLLLRLGPLDREERLAVFVLHHAAADGWSLALFGRELAALYESFAAGLPPALPEPPIQYGDWAAWQRHGQVEGDVGDLALPYWRDRLAGAPATLELPADRPRSRAAGRPESDRGGVVARNLPAAVEERLARLARREGATPFLVLASGFAALLCRWTGADDLLVGTPVANRRSPEVQGSIGFFVDTLVLRCDLSGDPGFRALLARIRAEALAAFAHADLPFERLVEELRPERRLARNPLFQVAFAVEETPLAGIGLPGLDLAVVDLPTGTAKFDLLLTVVRSPEGTRATVEYAADLFDGATPRRLLEHLATLLAGAAEDPDRPLSTLPLLAGPERHQLLAEWNDTAVAAVRTDLAAELARRAIERPEAVAIVGQTWAGEPAGGSALTYGELARRAGRLARRLAALGVGPEVPVALALERSSELVVAMLGVLRAGGAYVPLDPEHPRERLRFLIEDAGATVVVTRPGLLPDGLFAGTARPVRVIDLERALAPPAAGESGAPARGPAGPDGLAYLIYTSGSTGRPKGVAVTHRAVHRLVRETGYVRLGPGERVAHASTPVFDAATFEVWGALLNGATLVVFPPGAASPAELGERVVREGVSVLWLTAGLFHQVVESRPDDLAGVGQLLAGGDALSPAHVEALRRRLPGVRLIDGYGPTEGTTFTCCGLVDDDGSGRSVPIGRPIAGTVVYVLDEQMRPAPIGVPGELCIGGEGLARGYWRRPERTAESFLPKGIASRWPAALPGLSRRLYRTGDRARTLPDGRIEFLGRLDRQVKVRGFRVEPGEVEAALLSLPGVREAAVDTRPDPAGDRRLVAWVAADREAGGASPASLRGALLGKLPEHAVPSAFVLLPALPLTPQGKVDRRALPEPEALDLRGEAASAPPRGPVEEVLAGIWEEVLGLAAAGVRIGRDDDFFALGGHSLAAARVASRVRAALGVALPLRDVFAAPTVAGLAARLAGELRGEAPGAAELDALPLVPGPRPPDLPLSYSQERFWFLDQLAPGSPLYNIAGGVHLLGTLEVPPLAAALAEVVRRHEALRTVFPARDGRPVQEILPPAGHEAGLVPTPLATAPGRAMLPQVDLGDLPGRAASAEAGRLASRWAGLPFDLARGPLLRAALVRLGPRFGRRLGPDNHRLLLSIHHIAADGWSMEVLRREVAALYGSFRRGLPSPLAPLALQYADYAVWQRRALAGEALEGLLAAGRLALTGAADGPPPPPLALPGDRPRPPVPSYRGGEAGIALPAGLVRALAALARRRGATLFMVLLAGFEALLARWSGQGRFAVGTAVAGRGRVETEPLIGSFVNTLALPVGVGDDPAFGDLIERVRRAALEAFVLQDLPFEKLVESLGVPRDPGRAPVVQALFSFENLAQGAGAPGAVELPGLRLERLAVTTGTARLDLTLTVRDGTAGGLAATLEFARDLFDGATAHRALARLAVLLAAAAGDEERPLSALPVLAEAERHQLLAEWNDTAAGAERTGLAAELARQAAAWPEATAIVAEGAVLTYGELARRAGRLARRLAALGVGPEVPVALALPRSPELVAAMLAVAAAGGAYVPLDPAHPAERLRFLLEDAGAPVVITRPGVLEEDLLGALARPVRTVDVDRALATPGGGRGSTSGAWPAGRAGTVNENEKESGREEWPDRRPISGAEEAGEVLGAGQWADSGAGPASGGPAPGPAGPDGLAYLIYTSGSTGRPKGVGVTHRAVHRLVRDTNYVRLGPGERVAHASTPVFDAATFEVWGALLNAATLVIFPPGPATPAELGARVVREGISVLWLTAGLFHQMVESQPDDLAGVGQLLAGGDALSPAHVEALRRRLPGVRLIDGYGPTEGTTFTCCGLVEEPQPGTSVPIGRPVTGTTVYILDEHLRPAPIGVPGELCIGGEGLARGYWRRPERTAESFVPGGAPSARQTDLDGALGARQSSPGGAPSARLYRTGDRARTLADGRIEFLDRLDRQVKVRGFRVEPGEVEAALLSLPGVRAAAVEARPDPAGDRRLVAWVAADREASPAALRRALLGKLPEHAVPGAYVRLEALPLTPQGKVDRRALPEPAGRDLDRQAAFAPPRGPVEEVLAGIWQEVLGSTRTGGSIGRADDFFELGGHSLAAARVASRARTAFGVELPLADLFAAPTLAALAGRIAEELREDGEPAGWPGGEEMPSGPKPRVVPEDSAAGAPLSFSQERLWFLDQLEPGSPFYNIPGALLLRGRLAVPALAAAFGEVVHRHEALRTVFPAIDGEPRQWVLPPAPVPLPVADLGGLVELPQARQQAELAHLVAQWTGRPFDLARGPLLAPALVPLGPAIAGEEDRHALLLVLHHVVGDGWSMELLLDEVAALYAALAAGLPPAAAGLPELPLQYPDYARDQRRAAAGSLHARELAYWRDALAGMPPVLELPLDRPRPSRQSFRGGEVARDLPPALAAAAGERGRREGASLFMVLLAAFEALLARWTGQDDFAVGAPVAGRDRLETERLIGLFVNTLALRARPAPAGPFSALLAEARGAMLAAHAHGDLPFERLVAELAPARDASHQPLFQVMLAMENAPRPPASALPGLTVTPLEVPDLFAKFDLALAVTPRPDGGLRLGWSFARDLFDGSTVARLAAHFETLLAAATADPGRALADLPLLSAGELHQLRAEWNDTARDWALDCCVHHLIGEQVAARPEAVALQMDGAWLSYGGLDERVNRLARRLRELGVRPEMRVAVLLRRSFDTVAIVLAIAKAGGVYLPLAANYPPARLDAILRESEPGVVVSERDLAGLLPRHGGYPLLLDEERAALAALPGDPPPAETSPRHLAYIFYTSGSTGEPKGVMIEHHNFVHFLRTMQADIELRPGDVLPSWTTPTFDPSLVEWLSPLVAGARVMLLPEERVLDMPALAEELRAATWLDGIPGMYRQIVAHFAEHEDPADWRQIRGITAGGESVSTDLLEALHRAFPQAELRNSYGPTETTVLCAVYLATRHPPLRGDVIGRPLGNVVLHLLDAARNHVPIGVKGEVWIGGAGVGRGYFRREAWTAERYLDLGGERFFRTGDLGRYLADGHVEYLGRIDHQVKVRGFRIELAEIEGALAGEPGVQEVAVLAREQGADKRLVAYVVPDPGASPSPAALRRRVAERLPEYMVPSAFVFLEAMPRDANGKLDRRALPAPHGRSELEEGYAAPRTDLEKAVAGVWCEVLGIDRVGLDDNFFEMGGNSLLIVRLRARLEAATGRDLPVVELFRFPTVRALAERLEGEAPAEAVETAAVQARGRSRHESLARLAELRGQRRRR